MAINAANGVGAKGVATRPMTPEERKVIFASSLGTVSSGMTSTSTAHSPPSSPSNSSAVWMQARPSSLRCWHLQQALSCAPSARWCSAAWAT